LESKTDGIPVFNDVFKSIRSWRKGIWKYGQQRIQLWKSNLLL